MKLQLKRSLRLSGGLAQAPSAEQMSFGEIAVNYADADPSIFLKDSTNVIRKLAISALPDTSSSASQSGTLDDRYLRLNGGTLSGTLTGVEFIGGVARVSDNAPASGTSSELWFNSSNGRLYIRYGGQWVDASPDSFTMGTDFYSKTQTDTEISDAIAALTNGAVATNASNITANSTAIATNTSGIATNATAITNLTNGAVADNAAAITALTNGAVATNASNITANSTAIATNTSGIATNASAIASLTTDLASEESARLAAEADKMDVAGGTFTGSVSFNEDVIAKGSVSSGSGEITLNCEMNTHGVKVKGPAHSAGASYTLVLPPNTGDADQVLTTDGTGSMTWTSKATLSLSSLPALP